MKKSILQQSKISILLTLSCAALYYVVVQLYPAAFHSIFAVMLGWFFFQDFMLGSLLRHASTSTDPTRFVQMFQLAFALKFLTALVIFLLLVLKFPAAKMHIAIMFLGLYFIFLVAFTILFTRLLNRK